MAEWKSRGYVADSEEDTSDSNESQEHGQEHKPSASGSGHAFNDAEETVTHHDQNSSHDNPTECSAENTAFEDQKKEPAIIEGNVRSNSQETDEVQEGHYRTSTNALPHVSIEKVTPAPQHSFHESLSEASSPSSQLTTPPSSPKVPSLPIPNQSQAGSHHVAVLISSRGEKQSNDQPAPQQIVQRSEISSENPTGRSRNLRHRNPIQLHPYAIEHEKYRQVLQKRGVKPLRIAQGDSQSTRAIAEDSQAGAFTSDSESQDPSRPSSLTTSLKSQSELGPPPQNAFQDIGLEEDDLPDIGTILRQTTTQIAFNGHKRRKVMRSVPKQGRSADPNNFLGPSHINISKGNDMTDADQSFDIPLSPLSTFSSFSPPRHQTKSPPSGLIDFRGFRIPRGISPVALPTPVTSSEPVRRPASIPISSLSERSSSPGPSSDNESELSASEPAKGINERLAGAQRKIRGVLPASWLKLDLQAQAKTTKQKNRRSGSPSPEKDIVQQRGVARPVASRFKAHKASDTPIHVLYSSSDADSEQDRRRTAPTRPLSNSTNKHRGASLSDVDDLPLPSDLWGEVAEDNRIDSMLPAAHRQRKTGHLGQGIKSKKKKQTRLTEMQIKQRQTTLQETSSMSESSTNGRPRLFQSSNRIRKPKFRPPDLSLLDVPSPSSSKDGSRPSFLRVARRTVRSRNDKGKSVPDRKYLRMATDIETHEANEYLRSWREGTLKPKMLTQCSDAATGASLREPLQPCAGNRNPGTFVEWKNRVASQPSKPANARPRNPVLKTPRSRSIQMSLNHMINLRSRIREYPNLAVSSRRLQRSSVGDQARKGPIRAGHLVSSFRDSGQFRPATLESLQANVDRERPLSSFRHHLDRTTQEIAPKATANPLLAKFLEDDDVTSTTRLPPRVEQVNDSASGNPGVGIRRRGRRKREPHRRTIHPQPQSATDALEIDDFDHPLRASHPETTADKSTPLLGLGPFGTTYTTSFDIAPLPIGSYFTAATFLGSGDFANSFIARDLDQAGGFSVIQFGPSAFRWGPWNDNVSGQLGAIVDQSCESIQQDLRQDQGAFASVVSSTVLLLRQIVGYFSKSLSFYDAIDRISFLQRCKTLVSRLVQELAKNSPENADGFGNVSESQSFCMRALKLCVVLATQLRQISKHDVVPHPVQAVFKDFLEQSAFHALEYAFTKNPAGFAQSRERLSQPGKCPVVFDERHFAIELLVVVSHAVAEDNLLDTFWNGLRSSVVFPSLEAPTDARNLELCWERLLLVLPFLEIDRQGVLESGRRHKMSCETWTTVKHLLEPILKAYCSDTQRQSPTLNNYCRSVFGRCFRLIKTWGWRKCESNIGILFDFFARRSLFNLPNEEACGSPQFLAHLHKQPLLELATEDRCFHVFLKIIASGLFEMRKVYPDKKIGGIVWRLLPNHGRFLPKDQAISQVDLDALRNHHDLLCTLYWGSPQGYRPKPTVLQNLVDVENSHKEACHINIRSWSNLVSYQLTANEPLSSLEPFVKWLTELFAQIVRQHQNARTEAEDHVRLAEVKRGYVVSRSILESTIIQNQRQVEAILIDLLSSLQSAMNVAPDLTAAQSLLIPNLVSIFNLFSIRSPQTNKVILYGLEILLLFIVKASPQNQITASTDNDDSQDYGDWSALVSDALPTIPTTQEVAKHLERYFQDPLRQLLSNCFGADSPPEDALLTKVIDTWVAMGRVQVHEGIRSWAEYIGDYGHDTWGSLRDTEQRRKFSSYYLAVLIDTDTAVFKEYKQHVLKAWAASL
ncbi:MAG: hypothetical protein Q9226_007607, partial [Calogaya cf. arnoldii]